MNKAISKSLMIPRSGPSFEMQLHKNQPKIAKTMADVFSKIINENFAVTMKPTGQIASVDVPEPLVKALASGGGTSVMNEETLKQIMTQSAVTLPEKPVKKGESWENTQNVDLQFGVMTISSVLTYTGNDPSTG